MGPLPRGAPRKPSRQGTSTYGCTLGFQPLCTCTLNAAWGKIPREQTVSTSGPRGTCPAQSYFPISSGIFFLTSLHRVILMRVFTCQNEKALKTNSRFHTGAYLILTQRTIEGADELQIRKWSGGWPCPRALSEHIHPTWAGPQPYRLLLVMSFAEGFSSFGVGGYSVDPSTPLIWFPGNQRTIWKADKIVIPQSKISRSRENSPEAKGRKPQRLLGFEGPG